MGPPSSLSSASDGRSPSLARWPRMSSFRCSPPILQYPIPSLRQQMFNFSHSWSQSPYQYRDAPFNDRLPPSLLSCHHALPVLRPLAFLFFGLSSVSVSRARGGDRMVDISRDISAPARSTRSKRVYVQCVCFFTVLIGNSWFATQTRGEIL